MSSSIGKEDKRFHYEDGTHTSELAGAGRNLLELILIISIPLWLSVTIVSIILLQMTGGTAGTPFVTGIVITASIMYMIIIKSVFQQEPQELQISKRNADVS